jgi:hypothetical protein
MDKRQVQAALQQTPDIASKGAEALNSVLARSATDPDYRQKLLNDPRGAISEVTGKPLPADYKVAFIENKADATIVLPDPVMPGAQLSEGELEVVAGGCTPATGIVSIVGSVLWIASEVIEIVND